MNCFITGGAGFIGSNLVDRLLADGHKVVVFDNFSTGTRENLAHALKSSNFTVINGNTQDVEALTRTMRGCDFVFHLAANADVRRGTDHPRKDLEENTIATFNVLEAMRQVRVKRIAFSSTGSIYGEPNIFPTPEDAPFPLQTSLYGASKLAGEGLIQAFCEGFGLRGYIFRFVSIIGERYSHGHIVDFYNQLQNDPTRLLVQGNGRQRKSYLYVQDCITAMLTAIERADGGINIFNLGTDEYCEINDSISWITTHLGLAPVLSYTGGERGWIGDSPFIFLDCAKIRALDWTPRLSIKAGILKTLDFLTGKNMSGYTS